ncbi:aminoglycoside phosphotransferase family protein [Acidiferrobacter thiooxydans]|uniref:aminoglycoside phosphotransferase family protein n=1 Tax=Acidiferrobacter thiooxydans TaxID=163359 RepID=UPI001B8680CB|nr:phosphotransferase [Acidiferrobacter thiooxydans]
MTDDKRLAALIQFTRRILGTSGFTIAPASSDASFRRYFRITSGGESWVAMDAPPNKEPLAPFVRVAQRFGALGLHVPKVLACDLDTGLALLTDLGHTPYLDKLDDATADRLYGDALGALVVLQGGTFSDPDFLPPYDEVLLRREMELFPEWYLRGYLGHTITGGERRLLDQAFDDLSANALHQPQVWVHRDYHSRNLLVNTLHNPGILDFQDAVRGPITYDLVSLLKDCYVAWPRERVVDWVKGYCQLARESGLHQCDDEAVFLEWFDRMGIQRHLKVAGIFARLHLRDGKPGYLGDLPLTMHYLREATALYPDLCDLHTFLRALPESP